MVDIGVPYSDLDEVLTQVGRVRELFSAAAGSTSDASRLVGHGRLAGRVSDFSGAWDSHRGDLINACEAMEQAVRDTKAQFESWETSMCTGAYSLTADVLNHPGYP